MGSNQDHSLSWWKDRFSGLKEKILSSGVMEEASDARKTALALAEIQISLDGEVLTTIDLTEQMKEEGMAQVHFQHEDKVNVLIHTVDSSVMGAFKQDAVWNATMDAG